MLNQEERGKRQMITTALVCCRNWPNGDLNQPERCVSEMAVFLLKVERSLTAFIREKISDLKLDFVFLELKVELVFVIFPMLEVTVKTIGEGMNHAILAGLIQLWMLKEKQYSNMKLAYTSSCYGCLDDLAA